MKSNQIALTLCIRTKSFTFMKHDNYLENIRRVINNVPPNKLEMTLMNLTHHMD